MRHFKPRICILMETEVWPNLIAGCNAPRGVPVALVNARLSERSLRAASAWALLMSMRRAASRWSRRRPRPTRSACVRWARPGGSHRQHQVRRGGAGGGAGDRRLLRAAIGARPVLLCASTREGEEELILQAFQQARAVLPVDVLLLIVPRHPQRFDEVEKMVATRGLNVQRRSGLALDGSSLPAATEVLLGDSMGRCLPTMPPATSPLSAAACCRWAART
jgi:3-deoxy-D-manno-octulosonic-acid transferase